MINKIQGVVKMKANDGSFFKKDHLYYSKQEREDIINHWQKQYKFVTLTIVPKISPAREAIWERIIDECCE